MCNFGLTVSRKMAKISAVGRKSHHPIETLILGLNIPKWKHDLPPKLKQINVDQYYMFNATTRIPI